MSQYTMVIRTAVAFFPFIALLITLPFFIHNYHKYGSVSKLRTLIVYSFVLYMICALFLVILPLPTIESVANLKIARYQLMPFNFLTDFINKSGFVIKDIHSFLPALKSVYFYEPFFNIVLTIPFGIYLRYYFKCSLKKTFLLSFLLTLFLETTQLTGIYGIYPRNYRIFDVDDLLFNTIGGLVGYIIAGALKFLPSRESLDKDSYRMSDKVSCIRRCVTLFLDECLINTAFSCITVIIMIFHPGLSIKYYFLMFLIINFIYFVILPTISGRTVGKCITNLKISGISNSSKWYQRLFRTLFFYIYLFIMPVVIYYLLINDSKVMTLSIAFIYMLALLISTINLIRGETLWYENITKTKNSNTLKNKEQLI